jgi:hypothetical protein
MIILALTTDKIQVVLGEAATTELPCYASFRDRTSTTFTPNRSSLTTNDTTPIDLITSPAASTQRIVDFISIFNSDNVNHTVSVIFKDDGTSRIMRTVVLAPSEAYEYAEGKGWSVIASTGAIKQSINQGANAPLSNTLSTVVLGSDVTNNNAVANTIQDVTGLSFSVTANKMYYFKFIIRYTAAATTTGSRWGVNCSAGLATNLSLTSEYSLTTTTTTRNANIQAFDSPAASNATSAATSNNMAIMEGYFIPTADGTFIARFASEVLSSAITAKAGSVCYYQQLN